MREVTIEIDLLPEMGYEKVECGAPGNLQRQCQQDDQEFAQRYTYLPALVGTGTLDDAGIDGETFCNSVTRESPRASHENLSSTRASRSKGLLGMEKAVITAGGISLTEVDFKTMRSKQIRSNLYLVGDILNIDRPFRRLQLAALLDDRLRRRLGCSSGL